MLSLDPSLWLLVVLPFWTGMLYLTYRGLRRNEFRERGRWGWFRYETWSLDWFLSTFMNVGLLGAFTFAVIQLLFVGSMVSAGNAAEIHCVDGAEIVTADACSVQ